MAIENVLLGAAGIAGTLIMFAGDMILYYPSRSEHRSAAAYFDLIDPNTTPELLQSSCMRGISDTRLMIGGVLGPIAGVLYGLGFAGLYPGLLPADHTGTIAILPAAAVVGLMSSMVIGSVYHALFAYTGFIAKAVAASQTKADGSEMQMQNLVRVHQSYLKLTYKYAAVTALVGNISFMVCCALGTRAYPPAMALLAPALSAVIKLLLKRMRWGGLVLCGGLTNLWNLVFFCAATAYAAETPSS